MKKIKSINGSILLRGGRIYDPAEGNMFEGSILISGGEARYISPNDPDQPNADEVMDCQGKIITSGFTDIHVHFREPGREDKETLATGSLAAMAGGFTRVCVMPNTDPVIDTPESIRFILEKAKNLPIDIRPIGAITKGQKGRELAEIGEMVQAGAVAVSDDGIPLADGQMMRFAVEYAGQFGIPVINHAEDVSLRSSGVMNEGLVSTRLGMSGSPDISESVMIYRDLSIAEFTGGLIHIPHVSTAKSVDLIRNFKDKGIRVTAETTPHHIGLSDKNLLNFDTNAKVAPPLRTDNDQSALIEALRDGTIDCIATDHAPHTVEEKESDLYHAPCGMIGLESAFGMVNTVLAGHGFGLSEVIDLFTKKPSHVLGLDFIPIKERKTADFTIIDPGCTWEFTEDHIYSRSKNSPMTGMKFTGRIIATLSGNHLMI